MGFSDDLNHFNNKQALVEGWYWMARSKDVKKGKAIGADFWGKKFVLFRGQDGQVRLMDAFCPHMGAHLKDGMVEGNEIRCLFHYWRFNEEGQCTKIPCQKSTRGVRKVKTWPVQEKYGLIWMWTGEEITDDIPEVKELKGQEVDWKHGNRYTKDCHPNVVMINAIDAQHFASVHNIIVDLHMQPTPISQHGVEFSNTTPVKPDTWLKRIISKFYEDALTYEMCYWYGSTGSVTLGPKFIHFYIIFALRPTLDGRAEGHTLLLTQKRKGLLGLILNPIILFLTKIVGNYFAHGDTIIFRNINFNLQCPIKADHAIIDFISHLEKQKISPWVHPDALPVEKKVRREEVRSQPRERPPETEL